MPHGLANLSESPQGADLLLSGAGGTQRVAGSRAAIGSPMSTGPQALHGLAQPPPPLPSWSSSRGGTGGGEVAGLQNLVAAGKVWDQAGRASCQANELPLGGTPTPIRQTYHHLCFRGEQTGGSPGWASSLGGRGAIR